MTKFTSRANNSIIKPWRANAHKIKDVPYEKMDERLLSYLDSLPDEIQKKIVVTSAMGDVHSKTSRHYKGAAFDLKIHNVKNAYEDDVFLYFMKDSEKRKKLGITVLDPYHGTAPHIHISVGQGSEDKLDFAHGENWDYYIRQGKMPQSSVAWNDARMNPVYLKNTATRFSNPNYVESTLSGDFAHQEHEHEHSHEEYSPYYTPEYIDYAKQYTNEANREEFLKEYARIAELSNTPQQEQEEKLPTYLDAIKAKQEYRTRMADFVNEYLTLDYEYTDYSQKEDGGYIEKYPDGGTLPPIKTSDPNDIRLHNYLDSLNLYNAHLMQIKLDPKQDDRTPPTSYDYYKEATNKSKDKRIFSNEHEYIKHIKERKEFDKKTDLLVEKWSKATGEEKNRLERELSRLQVEYENKFNFDFGASTLEMFKNPLAENNKKDVILAEYYNSLDFYNPAKSGLWYTPDLAHRDIKPTTSYYGRAWNPVYAKPKQPYEYTGDIKDVKNLRKPPVLGESNATYVPNLETDLSAYLQSQGQPFDFKTRKAMAEQYGITDYKGTAEQNIALLNLIKQGEPPVQDDAAQEDVIPQEQQDTQEDIVQEESIKQQEKEKQENNINQGYLWIPEYIKDSATPLSKNHKPLGWIQIQGRNIPYYTPEDLEPFKKYNPTRLGNSGNYAVSRFQEKTRGWTKDGQLLDENNNPIPLPQIRKYGGYVKKYPDGGGVKKSINEQFLEEFEYRPNEQPVNRRPIPLPEMGVTAEKPALWKYQDELEANYPEFEGYENLKKILPKRYEALKDSYESQKSGYMKEAMAAKILKDKPYNREEGMDSYLESLTDAEKEIVIGSNVLEKQSKTYYDKIHQGYLAWEQLSENKLKENPRQFVKNPQYSQQEADDSTPMDLVEGVFGYAAKPLQVVANKLGMTDFKTADGQEYDWSDALKGKQNDAGWFADLAFDLTNYVPISAIMKVSQLTKAGKFAEASKAMNSALKSAEKSLIQKPLKSVTEYKEGFKKIKPNVSGLRSASTLLDTDLVRTAGKLPQKAVDNVFEKNSGRSSLKIAGEPKKQEIFNIEGKLSKDLKQMYLDLERIKKTNPEVDFSKVDYEYYFDKDIRKYIPEIQRAKETQKKSFENIAKYLDEQYKVKTDFINKKSNIFSKVIEDSPQYTDDVYKHLKNPKVTDEEFLNDLAIRANTYIRAMRKEVPSEELLKTKGTSMGIKGRTIDMEGVYPSGDYGDFYYRISPTKEQIERIKTAPLENKWSERIPKDLGEGVYIKKGVHTTENDKISDFVLKRQEKTRHLRNKGISLNPHYFSQGDESFSLYDNLNKYFAYNTIGKHPYSYISQPSHQVIVSPEFGKSVNRNAEFLGYYHDLEDSFLEKAYEKASKGYMFIPAAGLGAAYQTLNNRQSFENGGLFEEINFEL